MYVVVSHTVEKKAAACISVQNTLFTSFAGSRFVTSAGPGDGRSIQLRIFLSGYTTK
jgi:hypothetical protein